MMNNLSNTVFNYFSFEMGKTCKEFSCFLPFYAKKYMSRKYFRSLFKNWSVATEWLSIIYIHLCLPWYCLKQKQHIVVKNSLFSWHKFVLWLLQLRKKAVYLNKSLCRLAWMELADTTLLQRFWGKIVEELWLNWFNTSTSVHVSHDDFNHWPNFTSDLLIRKNVKGSDVDLRGSVLLLSLFWESQKESSTRELCVWWLVWC